MQFETEVKRWGNSMAVRLTGAMAHPCHLEIGTKIIVDSTEKGLFVQLLEKKRKLNLPVSLDDLLKGLDPHTAHADLDVNLLDSEFGE
jgi:antitoxin MazE